MISRLVKILTQTLKASKVKVSFTLYLGGHFDLFKMAYYMGTQLVAGVLAGLSSPATRALGHTDTGWRFIAKDERDWRFTPKGAKSEVPLALRQRLQPRAGQGPHGRHGLRRGGALHLHALLHGAQRGRVEAEPGPRDTKGNQRKAKHEAKGRLLENTSAGNYYEN